ncbi:hypothetical protein GCM10010261_41220 [Streptomyces pilosus]|uniref:Uncharacterized protein n=1 Tax=Streptomyces pilosus TaxID=28893 RepID=A0A918BSD9_9ACTN|nr:hypothetical protein GCM10010280_39230 [Streptomyces pilosus]GGV56261.1 hypothetical protein GCM10010261_41220 [Streptomyces pilosus]
MSALTDTCDQAQARADCAPGDGRAMPKAARRTGTPLVSRHFMRRNTRKDVTYTTMNGPGLTFSLRGA